MIFSRKSTRKIRFEQFEVALKLIAAKKFPGDAEGYEKLQKLILKGCGPKQSKTTVRYLHFTSLRKIFSLKFNREM